MKFNEAIEKLTEEAKNQLKDCKSLEDMLNIFASNGLQVTKQDIEEAINAKSGELSDDELSNVTGGFDVYTIIQDLFKLTFKTISNKVNDNKQ